MLFSLWKGAGFRPKTLLQFFPFAFPKEQDTEKINVTSSHKKV